MTAFAIGLAATYVILGVLVVITVRLSESAFGRMPVWGVLIVYLVVGALCAYTLLIGNVLAIMGAITVALGLVVLASILALPRWVPWFCDTLLRPFRRETLESRVRGGRR